jgi:hypothetical protein
VATFRDVARFTVRGLSYLIEDLTGQKWVESRALFSDLLAEATRAAFLSKLPGHPEQAQDALIEQAADWGLYQFRFESWSDFALRVRDHFARKKQNGSVPMVLRAIEEYGRNTWPVEWRADTTELTEDGWADFTVTIDHSTWSEDFWLDGVYDADLVLLAKEIRKWAPLRSKGTLVFRTDEIEI